MPADGGGRMEKKTPNNVRCVPPCAYTDCPVIFIRGCLRNHANDSSGTLL